MRSWIFAVIFFSSAACGEHRQQATPNTVASTPSTELPASASDGELPIARNGEALIDGVPVVVVERERILIDDQVVGSVRALEAIGKMNKIDAEFDALKAKREAWKAAHPGEAFPGVALLRMHRATKAFVVKSVFQTAAFSGHPNLAFVVETDGAKGSAPPGLARLNVDAFVPAPPDPATMMKEPELTLQVRLLPGASVTLAWKKGAELISEVVVPWAEAFERQGEAVRAPALAKRFSNEWATQGGHRDPRDKKLDQAVVLAEDTTELRDIVAVIDAAGEPKREIAGVGARVPAFNVTFSVAAASAPPAGDPLRPGPRLTLGATTVTGRLPPEVIQRVVRADFRKLRQCYEDGLHKEPKLAGKVAVRFVIGADGKVASATDGGSDLPSPAVVRCVIQSFSSLTFPPPEGGKVTVVYPIQFTP